MNNSKMTSNLLIVAAVILLLQTIKSTSSPNHKVNDPATTFEILETTIEQLQKGFQDKTLTSTELVKFYLARIARLNPTLRAVIEVNPDAVEEAQKADETRRNGRKVCGRSGLSMLHGVPILIKDNIGTRDKLNNTAGSFALVGSKLREDSGVVKRLRHAGAVIIGKASLSEWAHFRSFVTIPNAWCARAGQGKNPYNLSADACGSSSGSAIAVATNMVAVSLGTETDGSILCPSTSASVVGIKPTVGLTSRSGVIPISPRQDTVGPICRSVADAVHVLDAIVGFDPQDAEATEKASKYIPEGGYAQFLKVDGLIGKRLGIARHPFFSFPKGSPQQLAFTKHFHTLGQRGAVLIDNLEIPYLNTIQTSDEGLELLMAEFKQSLNLYLNDLEVSPVRSLKDVLEFNNKFPQLEMTEKYGQDIFVAAEATNGIGAEEKKTLKLVEKWSVNGFEKVMKENKLDAIITPNSDFSTVLAIGGYPGITVPAGYDDEETPFSICFGGLKGSEPTLIEIAYAFEQVTWIRKPPLGFSSPY